MPTFKKDPDAVLDYRLDWSDWLATGDTLNQCTFELDADNDDEELTIESYTNDTTQAVVWLSGGTDGVRYKLICHIYTTDGREDERSFHIRCMER